MLADMPERSIPITFGADFVIPLFQTSEIGRKFKMVKRWSKDGQLERRMASKRYGAVGVGLAGSKGDYRDWEKDLSSL